MLVPRLQHHVFADNNVTPWSVWVLIVRPLQFIEQTEKPRCCIEPVTIKLQQMNVTAVCFQRGYVSGRYAGCLYVKTFFSATPTAVPVQWYARQCITLMLLLKLYKQWNSSCLIYRRF